MIRLLLVSLLAPAPAIPSAPVAAAPSVPGRAQPAQDDETKEVQDKREDIQEMLGALADHVKKRGKEDVEAIAVIDKLYQEFPNCGPKDRQAIVDELEDCLKAKRTDELDPGIPDNRLYMAAAVSLKDMAPESVGVLERMVEFRGLKSNLPVRAQLILSLGKTRAPGAVKTLLGTLDDKDAVIQAAGAEALGEYEGMEQDVRKDVFEELLKLIMSWKAKVDTDPNDLIARERYQTISGPIITSMQRLTGHDERDPAEWQRWWNKNKKEDWDQERG